MKILIIKNDGFGDSILISKLIENIVNNLDFTVDIAITKNNEILFRDLKKINNLFKFDSLCQNYNNKKKISTNDILELEKIKKNKYEICIVLRRFLNEEQIHLMNHIESERKYTCYTVKNDNKIKLNTVWKNIKIPENTIHDFDYFNFFLKKLKLIEINDISINNLSNNENNSLVINFSGEKNIEKLENIQTLLSSVINLYKNKIYIIGKSLNTYANKNIKKYLDTISDERVINLWNKTNFENSMKHIEGCKYYIGFDTGLSHYAASLKKKSLILLSLGSGFRFWPYPKTIENNISYLTYNTPCSGCNFGGNLNHCHFNNKICVENILINPKKFQKYLNFFLKDEVNFFKNLSEFQYFVTDWNFYKAKISQIILLKKNGEIVFMKKKFKDFLLIIYNWLKFLLFNNNLRYNSFKLIIKNALSFWCSR